jgi:hypothetical protein
MAACEAVLGGWRLYFESSMVEEEDSRENSETLPSFFVVPEIIPFPATEDFTSSATTSSRSSGLARD